MKSATIYRMQSGEILRTITAAFESDILINVADGEGFIEGEFGAGSFYVRDGKPVDKPVSPGPWAVFDFGSGKWTDPRSAADVAADLEACRREAVRKINTISGVARGRFTTNIPGQEVLYSRKESEASRWLAADAPDIAQFPLIAAEIGITAMDANQIAQVWSNMADLWARAAANLETLRLGHIAQVEVSADQGGIESALAEFQQALETLE